MLELRGIERRFAGGRGLAGVNLDVARGELVALIGPSGAGKSTLLRIVAGLDRADRGVIRFHGRDITELGPAERRVGMTLDDATLYGHLTVRGNILAGLDRFGLLGESARRAAAQAAALVGAEPLLDRPTTHLSAGERRRVGLARAIARKPDILLLDEPLTHLDHHARMDLREDLRRIHDLMGCATVVVTHDHADAIAIADRLAYLDLGLVLQLGPPRDFERPAHIQVARGRSWHPLNVIDLALAHGAVGSSGSGPNAIAFPPEAVRLGEPLSASDFAASGTVHFRTNGGTDGVVLTMTCDRSAAGGPLPGTRIRLRVPIEPMIAVGQAIRISVPAGSIERFGPDGRRLTQ